MQGVSEGFYGKIPIDDVLWRILTVIPPNIVLFIDLQPGLRPKGEVLVLSGWIVLSRVSRYSWCRHRMNSIREETVAFLGNIKGHTWHKTRALTSNML